MGCTQTFSVRALGLGRSFWNIALKNKPTMQRHVYIGIYHSVAYNIKMWEQLRCPSAWDQVKQMWV